MERWHSGALSKVVEAIGLRIEIGGIILDSEPE